MENTQETVARSAIFVEEWCTKDVFLSGTAYTLIFFVTYFVIKSLAPRRQTHTDGPTGTPFVGSALSIAKNLNSLDEWFFKGTEKYGRFKKAWGFTMPRAGVFSNGQAIVLTTPSEVQHLLKDGFKCYAKGESFLEAAQGVASSGIFIEDGEAWKFHRKVAANMFSNNLMIDGTDVAVSHVRTLLSLLDKHAETGEAIDLQPCFFAFTMDTFSEIAFGQNLGTQTQPHPFSKSFDACQLHLLRHRLLNPAWKFMRLIRSPAERQFSKDASVVRNFVKRIVQGRRRNASPLGEDQVRRLFILMRHFPAVVLDV